MKIALLGAGAWGTALAICFAERHAVRLWTREPEVAASLQATRENARFLPGYPLPASITVDADLAGVVSAADLVVIATPIAGLRPTLVRLQALACQVPVVWACKGFEAGSGLLPHQVVREVLGEAAPCAVLSGPSFAEEVAAGQPTAISLAAGETGLARDLARELHSARLRVYANDDLIGVEVGGAVKNVLAIATGVCDGLGLGLNSRAALMTRGLAEIARLGVALGGRRDTFLGLSGMGDLILTCTGDLSRNRRVGLGLASGQSLAQVLEALGHVAEGVYTARETARLADRMGIDMPICQSVAAVLDGRLDARTAVAALLSREPREEWT